MTNRTQFTIVSFLFMAVLALEAIAFDVTESRVSRSISILASAVAMYIYWQYNNQKE